MGGTPCAPKIRVAMARTIVIGDIHGCYDELENLLKILKLDSYDRVISVGDLTVKGPKSAEVVEVFSRDPRFSSVIGNHDLALVEHWLDENNALTSSQQKAFDELKKGHREAFEYLAGLPYFIELETHIVVHAGVRPGIDLQHQDKADLTELRTLGPDRTKRKGTPWYEVYDGEKIVLFGHWPASEPRRANRAIGLDTGCVYGYELTAYIIETGEFLSTPARTAYTNRGSRR